MRVKPVPDGYHSLTPYLGIEHAAQAIEFYKKAFGAIEVMRLEGPNGTIGHAELRFGDSPLMLATPCDQQSLASPASERGSSVALHFYVDDVDQQFATAVAAGARVISPLQDQFYGDRSCTLGDPFGHIWFLATRIENLTEDEIRHRAAALFNPGQ